MAANTGPRAITPIPLMSTGGKTPMIGKTGERHLGHEIMGEEKMMMLQLVIATSH